MQREPLTFLLEPGLLDSAQKGAHNFIAKMQAVLETRGHPVRFAPDTAQVEGSTIRHMQAPDANGLTFRRVYHYPFWQIETTAERWNWQVAQTEFPGNSHKDADRFYGFWQTRLFGDAPGQAQRDGFVYVPLQGRLETHRSFQTCAPLDMIEEVLRQDPDRKVIAALHPKPTEPYSASELAKLEALERRHPRLSLVVGDMERLLQGCDYVVTQNSASAFNGYFFGKPAVLFARIDFHHIASNVHDLGVKGAFERVIEARPDYAGYVHWFWQHMSINAGRPEAESKIEAAFTRCGWT